MDNYTHKLLKTKEFFLNLFFPKFCLGCQKEGIYLCDDCRHLLDINEFDYCLCDKKPNRLPLMQTGGKCNRCQDKKLAGLYSALPYNLPAGRPDKNLTKKLIRQFKYQPYLKDLAKTLASIIIEHFVISGKNNNKIWENSILVPVPIDKNKFKSRGYNQSEELAKELAKILKVPVVSNNLIKIKNTKPQMELTKRERENNLENAFLVKNASAINQHKIFLVDDVYTTGSTLEECAKTLRNAGAKQVWGICIAREE